ncbi:FtsX-like permease family protein [Natronorubrum sp. JWXQ-INN-674]|uniref:FtsX-like permease family protein n=1 Tax=Natronorubrum halalkaliphilum TaxID=2691917 RepID=A0A6B0VRP1_9EURY|nr:ABC transporter permease [Natronorubrum halalkaliphilum]MXV64198.1 FtsX-like permease family protein [Natronorubrum halalkaliphilum]
MSPRELLVRWLGVGSVGIRRTISRATRTATKRVQFSVAGVAVVIALLVVVTGIGIGLAAGTTVYDDDVDYWIVPESDGERSTLLSTDQPQFGSVHETNDRIRGIDDVAFASPVLSEVVRIEIDGTSEYVLAVGVINSPDLDSVTDVSTDGLSHDDPYHQSGSDDDEWTGEVVLSRSAASLLEADPGDGATINGEDSFTVAATDEGTDSVGDMPIALVQLSELQTLTGGDEHDQADQFVVGTNSPAVEDELAGIYPQSEVLTRGELTVSEAADSGLPLALALTALIVSVSVGTLFVLTTNGLEVVADRRQLATLSALGVSTRSQLGLVGTQTLVITGIGGLLGAIAGLGGIRLVNYVATATVTSEPIATSHLLFVPYGLAAALLIGLLSLPVLLVLTRRVTGGVP